MSELLPCPFCGGEAQVARTAAGYWAAYCEEPMCGRVGNFKTEADAIEAWNTRAERTCELTLDGTDGCFGCSECDENIPPLANYCPNCGAKVVSE